ncbi:MAG: molybdopterin-dependent oxidoreductase [Alphaproteobacteria bacterium]|nr:molybdopterin-dependent oxidoreductase [Alphaproteobacteria bacterium]
MTIVGSAVSRVDGPAKVTGTAVYAADFALADLAHAALVQATVPRGRIHTIHTAEAEAAPGVRAVLTHENTRPLPWAPRDPRPGVDPKAGERLHVLQTDEVFYNGQPVALVVAETYEQACHGALALQFEIERDEGSAVDPEAVEPEAPDDQQSSMGDLDAAMRDAVHSVDVTYTTPGHSSAPMEPHASIADWDGDRLTLRGSYQMLKFNRNELADSLGIDPSNVRILSPYVGGGFGSKLGIAPEAVAAALAARQLGRPVSVAMSRPQVFETTMRRSETRQRVRLAAGGDGRLTGIGHEALVSSLPGEAFSEPVTQATPFMYRGDNRTTGLRIARVNRTCAGSVRAPGEAVGVTAFENAMDEMAEKAGLDPVAFRKINIPAEDPSQHIPFSSHKLAEALDEGARAFGWDKRRAEPRSVRDGEWLVGMGMASAFRVNMVVEAEARVRLNPDGTAEVETDMTDIGTGSYAVLSQIACEMLGLPADRVTTRLGDTELPPGSGSGGSFGASSSGTAVFLACEEIRGRIAEALGCAEGDLTLKDGVAVAGNRATPLAEVLGGRCLEAEGHVEPGETSSAVRQATYGAYFAEVAVNAVTGETRVRRMLGAFAAGRILNRKTARSQFLGGMTWGIGMALTEALLHDPRHGQIVNHDLAEYHVAVNADVPQIDVLLLDERDDWSNPMQTKGLGELGVCGAAAAVTNALYNATGVRVRDYPATLDKVLAGGL